MIKVLLSVKYKKLPPSLHFNRANEHILFEKSPFYVNTELTDWKPVDGAPRRAAVSSFGYSGTNAHLVIEEYCDDTVEIQTPNDENKKVLIPLSALNEERLEACVEKWLAYLNASPGVRHPTLRETAYTLQAGRTPMDHRLAFLVEERK